MQRRRRPAYLAMSLLAGWHCLAMVVAAAPNSSAPAQSLRLLLQPYLSLFNLDTSWNFFAPAGQRAQFRYVVEDAAGNKHIFAPAEELRLSLPGYVWQREFTYLYDRIMEAPQTRGSGVGALLCRKHAALEPRSVTLLELREQDVRPEDKWHGNRPPDPELTGVNTLISVDCRDGAALPRRAPIRPIRKPS